MFRCGRLNFIDFRNTFPSIYLLNGITVLPCVSCRVLTIWTRLLRVYLGELVFVAAIGGNGNVEAVYREAGVGLVVDLVCLTLDDLTRQVLVGNSSFLIRRGTLVLDEGLSRVITRYRC